MINRRSMLLGSASAAVTVIVSTNGGDSLTQDELRLLAMSVGVPSSVDDYNRTHTFAPGTDGKKTMDSLTDRGLFVERENNNPNANCDYFVEITEKGLSALRAAGVLV